MLSDSSVDGKMVKQNKSVGTTVIAVTTIAAVAVAAAVTSCN